MGVGVGVGMRVRIGIFSSPSPTHPQDSVEGQANHSDEGYFLFLNMVLLFIFHLIFIPLCSNTKSVDESKKNLRYKRNICFYAELKQPWSVDKLRKRVKHGSSFF